MSTHVAFHFQHKEEKSALIVLNLPLWDFSKGLKNEFETAVVDEPSVFERLKFFCICQLWHYALLVFELVTLLRRVSKGRN